MKQVFFIIAIILLFISCKSKQKKEIVTVDTAIYETYNLKNADELVLDAFSNSDIVILGENHFIGEHIIFVADLIPKLHAKGINTLYSEFTYLDDAKLVDSLINAETFNEQLAKNLLVSVGWDWMYKEYLELYRSAWALNKTIKNGKKFKIVGLELGRNYDAIQTPEDWKKTKNRMAYFRESENDWADRIILETIEKGEKALVYCGIYHGLTFYNQPIVINGKFSHFAKRDRAGQFLYEKLKDNCKFIVFHFPWESKNNNDDYPLVPLSGKLEILTDSLTKTYKSFGFYTQNSSLGKINDTTSFLSNGYSNFNLSKLCDAYLVIEPVCKLNLCEFIPNFIDSTNIEIARPQIRAWENINNISIKEANKLLIEGYNEQLKSFEDAKSKMSFRK